MLLDLTNYEMLDLANSHVANAADDLNRLTAAFTAYLIVSYKAGKELTKFQVLIVTVLFVFVAGQAGHGAIGEMNMAINYWRSAWGEQAGSTPELFTNLGGIVGLLGIFFSIAFMWRVRHPKRA